MLLLAILVALLVDALAVLSTMAVLRRSDSTILRTGAICLAVLVVLGTTAAASLATITVQTRIVMAGMARQEPMASIIANDRQMRSKIETAVRKGLEAEGSKVENVRNAVGDILKPYMTYRLGHAPDRHVIASARSTLGLLARAKAEGPGSCAAVLSGDIETMRRLATSETSAWLPAMLRDEPLDDVRIADDRAYIPFLQSLIRQNGWTQDDLAQGMRRQGPLACTVPAAVIERAMELPEDQAAAMLRRFGFGAQAVTAR